MRFLFIHPSFPGQFLHLAHHLGTGGHQVAFLTMSGEPGELPGVRRFTYKPGGNLSLRTHPYLRSMEKGILLGQATYQCAAQLKSQGFVPDAIIGQAGCGSSMYMKDLFPTVPLINHFDWYYHAHGTVAKFDSKEHLGVDEECRIRTQNGPALLDLYNCDVGVIPMYWQHSQFPAEYARKIKVIFEGINTEAYRPQPEKRVVLPKIGLDLSHAKEIVTYASRGLEPCRGFPQFMKAIAEVQRQRSECQVVVVGSDEVLHDIPLSSGQTWKKKMLKELTLDHSRLHFTGLLNREDFVTVLQASTVHVYLSSPFILSRSMLEAMSCGCALVASATQPVQEVVLDGVNGLLADFFSPQKLAEKIVETLSDPSLRNALSHRARETIMDRYDLRQMLPRHLNLIQQMMSVARSAGQ